MPDLRNYSVTRNGNVNASVPRYTITCDVVNSRNGELIRSYNINFPNILSNLSDDQLDELFTQFIGFIIQKKIEAGLS